jgi:Icc protein
MATQYGQYPDPLLTVAHLSDPHILIDALQYGAVDTVANFRATMERLSQVITPPQALVFTGDLADEAQPEAYRALKEMVEPVAAEFGAQVIWTMGNHDERAPYSRELFGEESLEKQDRVHDVNGLRIIALDTSVPGYHYGEINDDQLAWLEQELRTPAPHGTVLAMHHPPIPVPMTPVAAIIELYDQDKLASVLEGSDVRAILGGHFHFTSSSTFAGIPVHVASASCYTMDPAPKKRLLSCVDAHLAFTMLHLYDDRAVFSVVPVFPAPEIHYEEWNNKELVDALSFEERREILAKKSVDVDALKAEAMEGKS